MNIEYCHNITVSDYNFLRKSAGWREIEEEQAQRGINNTAFLITAVNGNKTIGMARLITDGGYAYLIVDVIVYPDYQHMGIGKNLMQNVMDYIKSNLKTGQIAYISLMSAKGKEKFYEKFGFTARPTEDIGCGMTQWIEKA